MEGEMDSFLLARHLSSLIISLLEGLRQNTIQVTGKCFGATK